ncbi:MAG TPA: homoserine O-acetyltransferase [Planctomycetes bacterium]|nr:homoserine O-acetyltransferase [Planctomycetota bacterium]
MAKPPGARHIEIDKPFSLELGGVLPRLEVAWESWGTLNSARDNAILVCPAFSAHCHAKSSTEDPSAGWWERMIGPGAPLDTDRYFVLCASLLGGCHGTSGPLSLGPDGGAAYEGRFPLVTIGDQVRAHLALVDHLGISCLYAACGGSMGAMQTLEMGLHHAERLRRVIAISGTDRTRPATAAIRHLGRRAIMLDPRFNDGMYGEKPPIAGLELAREIGTVFYRSQEEFNHRFAWEPAYRPSLDGPTFEVQSYLLHQGKKILRSFDSNAYLRLSLAMDLHDIERQGTPLAQLAAQVDNSYLIGGVTEDRLITIEEQKAVRDGLLQGGAHVEWFEISSAVGHDAFLVDVDAVGRFIAAFLES